MSRALALVLISLCGCTTSNAADRIPIGASGPPSALGTDAAVSADAPLETAPDARVSSWCLEGFAAFDDDSCYLIPPSGLKQPKALLIYLHGVIAPQGDTQRIVQGVVARNAVARGYVALMPRGRRGLGPSPVQDWWSWPTTAENHRRYAGQMVQSWIEKRRLLEGMTGGSFERTYLAGSSNGAFFATVLALNGEIVVDGFGAMSGGSRSGRSKATIRAGARPAFYVGYGIHDDLKPHPISLGELLRESDWPHRVGAHPTGHGAREVYLDEAFAFWGGP
jgi:predicted esterase